MLYISNEYLTAAGDSVVGRVRSANEDSCGYAAVPNGQLFVVCDGMGGHVGGATASRIAVDSIIDFLSRSNYANIPQALNQALEFANIQIIGKAQEDTTLTGMGTTACILLVDGGDAWIAHIGDSRIYLFCKEQETLFRITKDHSYVQTLVDAGEISDLEAESDSHKNIILKALGIKDTISPEVVNVPMKAAAGDVFLICSDGLCGMINDDQIEHTISSGFTPEECVSTLITDANEPGKGQDNITAQIIQINCSSNQHSSFVEYNPNWRKERTLSFTNEDNPIPEKPLRAPSRLWIYITIPIVIALVALTLLLTNRKNPRAEELSKLKTKITVLADDSASTVDNIKKAEEYKNKELVEQEKGKLQKQTDSLADYRARLNDLTKQKTFKPSEILKRKLQKRRNKKDSVDNENKRGIEEI